MLTTAGLDPKKVPAPAGGVEKWTPVMILPASKQEDKSRLARSIAENVDDIKKRRSYVAMVDALFRAITLDDFSSFFEDSSVTYKSAHKFKYKNKFENLRELKHGNKDRIYIFPYNGKCGKFLFVLEVLHKDQQNTPEEIKQNAETAIKLILDAHIMGPIN